MNDLEFLNALSDCIDRLANGQTPDDCLSAYPHYAADLRPMLEAGLQLRRVRIDAAEMTAAKDRVRVRLQAHHRRSGGWLRAASGLAAILVAALVGLSVIAEGSLPGDALYAWKQVTENVWSAVSGGSPAVMSQLAQRRRTEVSQLLALKRMVDVTFEGIVQANAQPIWRVSDIPVQVSSSTVGASSINVGDEVAVRGETIDQGQVMASSIALLHSSPFLPTPTPSSTPTPTPTATLKPQFRPSLVPSPLPVQPTAPPVQRPVVTASTGEDKPGDHGGDHGGSTPGSGD